MVLTFTFLIQPTKDDMAYTQVSDKPEQPTEASSNKPARNGSYIAMSPVET